MPNLRSAVERTLHLQLQYFARFRALTPVFVGLALFSVLPTVGRSPSSTFVSKLVTALGKFLKEPSALHGIPILNTLFNISARAFNTACLRVRIYVQVPIQWRQLFTRGPARPWSDDTYATPRAEAKYWRVAGRYSRRLYSSNDTSSTASRGGTVVPLVAYYTPRLLPTYRNPGGGEKRMPRRVDADATIQEGRMSPRTFCKWHRMVFRDLCHPTLAQAAVQMKYYSNRDLREIRRIARLLPDEQVFGRSERASRKAKGTTKYSEMWKSWLENKGLDLVVVFE